MEKNKNTRIKPKVAFICVHNSCRSQIAEALGKHLASDVFESYSAGTGKKPSQHEKLGYFCLYLSKLVSSLNLLGFLLYNIHK